MRAASAVVTFGRTDDRIYQLFKRAFTDGNSSLSLLLGSTYLPRILGVPKPKNVVASHQVLPLETPTDIEALFYFHGIQFFSTNLKKVRVSHVVGNRIGFAVQTCCKALIRCVKNITCEDVNRVLDFIMPYIFFDKSSGLFMVIKSRSEGFSCTDMVKSLEDSVISNEQSLVSGVAWNRSDEVDNAIRCVMELFLTEMNILLKSYVLYQASEKNLLQCNRVRQFKLPDSSIQISPIFA